MALTLTPLHKKLLSAIAVVVVLFLVWHFFLRKSKTDGKTSLLERIKSKEKELRDCILKGGTNCASIKSDLTALVKKAPAEVKAEVKAESTAAAAAPTAAAEVAEASKS